MNDALRGHGAMLLFSILVAGSFSLGALASPFIAPELVTVLRFAIAAVLLGILCAIRGDFKTVWFVAIWRYILLGGVFATYFVLMFAGLKTATPVSAAAVFTLTPILTAFASYILLRQITTKRIAGGLLIGALGALWVIFRADWATFRIFEVGKGEIIYFWGCIAHAVYIPLVRLLNRGESAVLFSFGTTLGGTLVLLAWSWSAIWTTDYAALPNIVWLTILYVSIFATAVTFVLGQFASLRLPGAKVMAYTYLIPSWVILWEIALGHGAPRGFILGGVLLTIVALVVLLKHEDTGGHDGGLSQAY
ncbi:DMT family transporter [Planktotalea sp.]|uniref:DMT family transporter n=1 Tax=Planktotalea sp. TaxID=2029877 RepID=UPI0025F766D6|nr:DMT family transporter [Planktotalea sp.]